MENRLKRKDIMGTTRHCGILEEPLPECFKERKKHRRNRRVKKREDRNFRAELGGADFTWQYRGQTLVCSE